MANYDMNHTGEELDAAVERSLQGFAEADKATERANEAAGNAEQATAELEQRLTEAGALHIITGSTQTTFTGLLMGDGTNVKQAEAGADYVQPSVLADKQNKITASGLLKGDGNGGVSAAVEGEDYVTPAALEDKQDKITAVGVLMGTGNGEITDAEMMDYVIGFGMSGLWTYRKWKSGVAECWGIGSYSTATNTQWGSTGLYYGAGMWAGETYPSGLFVAAPICTMSYESDGGYGVSAISQGAKSASKDRTPTYQFVRPQVSGNIPVYVSWHAIGRWK